MYCGPKFPFLIDADWINVAQEKGEPFAPIPANLSVVLYDPQGPSGEIDHASGDGASGVRGAIWDESELNQFLEWYTGEPMSKISIRSCGSMDPDAVRGPAWTPFVDLDGDRIRVTFERS